MLLCASGCRYRGSYNVSHHRRHCAGCCERRWAAFKHSTEKECFALHKPEVRIKKCYLWWAKAGEKKKSFWDFFVLPLHKKKKKRRNPSNRGNNLLPRPMFFKPTAPSAWNRRRSPCCLFIHGIFLKTKSMITSGEQPSQASSEKLDRATMQKRGYTWQSSSHVYSRTEAWRHTETERHVHTDLCDRDNCITFCRTHCYRCGKRDAVENTGATNADWHGFL